MKRKVIASVLAVALLVGGYQKSAKALGFPPLPPIIPDICFVSCITWTHSTLLLDIEQYYAMVQNFANIAGIGGLQGAAAVAGGIEATAVAAPPMQSGVAAATQTETTSTATTGRIAAIDAQARTADGVTEHAQVSEAYFSTIAGNGATTNTLLSQHETQTDHREKDAIANYLDEFGPTSTVGPGSNI